MSQVLQEFNTFEYEVQELNESGSPKKFRLKGLFQKGDTPNGNGRSYPAAVLESAISSVNPTVQEGRMLGELDHPDDAKIHLDKVSHKVTKLEMGSDGSVYGEAEVLTTPAGKILESLIKSGVKLGISSRGFGSTKEVGGLHEVQDDYKLVTFDIVSDPSTPGAFPKPVYEHREMPEKKEMNENYTSNLEFMVDEALDEGVELDEKEYRQYVVSDDDKNMFYIVEGEKDSYGYLNFHASHDYHVLVKKEDMNERIGLNEENLGFIKKIYGQKVFQKLSEKINELGYNPKTLNLIKEE